MHIPEQLRLILYCLVLGPQRKGVLRRKPRYFPFIHSSPWRRVTSTNVHSQVSKAIILQGLPGYSA